MPKMPDSRRSTERKSDETTVMEKHASTFNHDAPLYAETKKDVKAATALTEAGIWKGNEVSFHLNKESQKEVREVAEARNLKPIPPRTKRGSKFLFNILIYKMD